MFYTEDGIPVPAVTAEQMRERPRWRGKVVCAMLPVSRHKRSIWGAVNARVRETWGFPDHG